MATDRIGNSGYHLCAVTVEVALLKVYEVLLGSGSAGEHLEYRTRLVTFCESLVSPLELALLLAALFSLGLVSYLLYLLSDHLV